MEIEGLKNICRLCMKDYDTSNLIEITKETEDLFYDLTQCLLKDLSYNLVCNDCLVCLNQSVEIKRNFIYIQLQFNAFKNEQEKEEQIDEIEDEYLLDDDNNEVEYFKTEILDEHETKVEISQQESKIKEKRKISQKQCEDCGKMVTKLDEHCRLVHSKAMRYFCDLCDYSCYFKHKIIRHISKHINIHDRSEIFSCPETSCTFVCSRKDYLYHHVKRIHQIERPRNFKCSLCDKSFHYIYKLKRHTSAVHEKIQNFTCSICGMSFHYEKSWLTHEKRHFDKTEKCDECGKLFFCQQDLRRHFKLSHTEPDIICDYPECGKKFHLNAHLKLHVQTVHQRMKPFACKLCDMTFGQRAVLSRHVNSIHKARRCPCAIPGCSFTFSRKDKYKNHIRSMHKTIDKEGIVALLNDVKFE